MNDECQIYGKFNSEKNKFSTVNDSLLEIKYSLQEFDDDQNFQSLMMVTFYVILKPIITVDRGYCQLCSI